MPALLAFFKPSQSRGTVTVFDAFAENISETGWVECLPDPVQNFKQAYRKRALPIMALALAALALIPTSGFAQTSVSIDRFKTAVTQITQGIQTISAVAVVLLIVAGFGLLIWGGAFETARAKGVRIVLFAVIGAGCLFLFAQPLADFLVATFQTGGTGA